MQLERLRDQTKHHVTGGVALEPELQPSVLSPICFVFFVSCLPNQFIDPAESLALMLQPPPNMFVSCALLHVRMIHASVMIFELQLLNICILLAVSIVLSTGLLKLKQRLFQHSNISAYSMWDWSVVLTQPQESRVCQQEEQWKSVLRFYKPLIMSGTARKLK